MLSLPLVWAATQLSTVAIELPEGTEASTAARVVDSCNQALGGPRCHPAGGEQATTLYAIVSWEGSLLSVSLYQGGPTGKQLDRRDLTFSDVDARQDRFITAGLIVAALTAGARASLEATPPEEPQAPEAPEAPPLPAPAAEPPAGEVPPALVSPRHAGFDLEGQLGRGASEERLEWGVGGQAFWIAHTPRLGAMLGVEARRVGGPVEIRSGGLSAGMLVHLTPWQSGVGVEFSAAGLLQRVTAEAQQGGATDTGALWRGGGKLGAVLLFSGLSWLEPYAAARLTLLNRGFRVTLNDDIVGTEPKHRLLFALGLRLLPF